MSKANLKQQVFLLPNDPGVYQFYDKLEKIIYVGKAKDLKKRVSSYFRKKVDSEKTKKLVSNIRFIKHIVVPTESDALILENSLIKEHQPKYNILLRDDKTYPWICIKKERFPRVFLTRKIIKDGSEYFGPYTNVKGINYLLELIKNLYPIRISNYNFTEKQINSSSRSFFLNIHKTNEITLILGFKDSFDDECNSMNEELYLKNISFVREILKGNLKTIKSSIKKQMLKFSSNLEFEKAQTAQEKLKLIQSYQSNSSVVSSKINNTDVFGIVSDQSYAYINFLKIVNGYITQFYNMQLRKKLDETDEEILRVAVVELRQRFLSKSKEILLPFKLDLGEGVKTLVPKIGEKKQLLSLSIRNAKHNRIEQLKQIKFTDPEQHTERIMSQMQQDLRLKVLPLHIECFDNSNIQGSDPTAACVVFRDGKPSKKEYRHYGIKTVVGPDDFASMEEVVCRRYKRLISEGGNLPHLVIIDGGKGQLNAALKSFEVLGIRGKVAILGIAKRLEELYFPDDPVPLYLDKRSETLRIIQQLRNEAHRFGIRLHRNKRSKGAINSTLEQIPGIGHKTAIILLKKFKSVKRIRLASIDALSQAIGISLAKKIYNHFHNQKS